MGPWTAIIVGLALAGTRPPSAEVSWSAGVPFWTSLSPSGQVVAAGPAVRWTTPPPAARLVPEPRPAPTPVPTPPRELPGTFATEAGPMLPPGAPVSQLMITPPTTPPLPVVPDLASPPLAIQATQRPVADVPAARLSPPSR